MECVVDFSRLPEMTNKWIQNIWINRYRYVICKGGGGSGKSYGIVQLNVYRFLTEPGHKYLVVRKVAKTIKESIFQLIKDIISSFGCTSLVKIMETDKSIECKNGNKIIFAGLDDVEKLKSIQGVTDIIIEEGSELEVADYRQLDIRLRGQSKYYKQMYIMFNPIDINHWLKKEFFDRKKEDCITIETNYKDNRFLDENAKKVLEGFKETDPYFYNVYCLGNWGVLGKTIFDAIKLGKRLTDLENQIVKRGYFKYSMQDKNPEQIDISSIQFINDESGYITIYKDRKANRPYVIGGDTSGEGSDFFTGCVLDNITGEQVAVYHHQQDEDLYAKQMFCLGHYYNYALIGLEVNFSTYPVKELTRLGYHRQFMREKEDTMLEDVEIKWGFKTTKLTRPLIISELVEIVREHTNLLNDKETIKEMLSFIRNEKGRPQASEGAHDDLVMGIAIAYYIRDQQSFRVEEEYIEEAEPDDDDYRGGYSHKLNDYFE